MSRLGDEKGKVRTCSDDLGQIKRKTSRHHQILEIRDGVVACLGGSNVDMFVDKGDQER